MAAKATEVTSFGVWVRDRRRSLDLTQEELANSVGCSVSAIRKIEGDLRRPSEQVAELLGRVLEVAPEQQALFLKVARGILGFDRLEAIAPLGGRVALPMAASPAPPTPAGQQRIDNVPVPVTPLVGRGSELAQIEAIFADPACRLLTITGPGGIGKTRLALEGARRLRAAPGLAFADGAAFVGLAAIARGEELPQSIAAAVGLPLRGAEPAGDQVLHHLRPRRLLLLLDNFEHVVEGADWLADLLARAPGVRLLVTSRERLNLQSEWILDIQGLPVPPEEAAAAGEFLPGDGGSGAVALFAGCARRVSAGFTLTPDDAPHVVRICRLLGGMPLAIELAASWVHVLSCAEIAAEIERNVDFLVSTARDLPARHRSLRAAFDHSWRLLDDPGRSALARLSVFRGGFAREAAVAVAQAPLPVLLALVDKSLVRRAGGDRFDLHEVVRQYAGEHLAQGPAGSLGALRGAHAAYCAALVERARAELRGAHLLTWQRRLDDERDNLNAALDWAIGSGDAALAARLAGGLWRYWWLRGAVGEGRRWMDAAIALAERAPVTAPQGGLALLYHGAGVLARVQGDFARSRALHEQALALRRALDDVMGIAASLNSLGLIAMFQGDYTQAEAWFAESLGLHTQQGSARERLTALNNLGVVCMYRGDLDAARRCHEETLAESRRLDDRRGIGTGLGNLGDVLRYQSDFAGSRRALEESLTILREFDDRASVATTLYSLGRLALCERVPAEAAAAFRE